MTSGWLEGTIRHRRKQPVQHEFTYPIGLLALDLDEWPTVTRCSPFFSLERFNWLSLYRRDYLDPEVPSLRQAVYNRVKSATGWAPDGPIELITHPRYLGYVFNPVSFYFCYERGQSPANGDTPRVIAAQITNTPWKERHVYCLECQPPTGLEPDQWHTERFSFEKRFHVSPFNEMNQHYHWVFSFRGPELRIHMTVRQSEQRFFDATLVVQRQPLTRKILHRGLRRFPLETIKGTAGIYWNALKLKFKGAVFYTHPDKLAADDPAYRKGVGDSGLDVTESGYTQSGPDPEPDSHRTATNNTARVSSWRT